jgi:hypothetical protein
MKTLENTEEYSDNHELAAKRIIPIEYPSD